MVSNPGGHPSSLHAVRTVRQAWIGRAARLVPGAPRLVSRGRHGTHRVSLLLAHVSSHPVLRVLVPSDSQAAGGRNGTNPSICCGGVGRGHPEHCRWCFPTPTCDWADTAERADGCGRQLAFRFTARGSAAGRLLLRPYRRRPGGPLDCAIGFRRAEPAERPGPGRQRPYRLPVPGDRKSTRLNSSHLVISYAVFCLKKKTARSCNTTIAGQK